MNSLKENVSLALFVVSQTGHYEMINFLVEPGNDVYTRIKIVIMPLYMAFIIRNYAVGYLLIESAVDVKLLNEKRIEFF